MKLTSVFYRESCRKNVNASFWNFTDSHYDKHFQNMAFYEQKNQIFISKTILDKV